MKRIITFDTPEDLHHWKTVDDVVMGGRSQSHMHWIDDETRGGILRFEGEVSLENNGGFCSARNEPASPDSVWDLSEFSELVWTLRGTNRRFLATLRAADTPQGASFRHPFAPQPEAWQDLVFAFEDFRLFRRGNRLSEDARIDTSQIVSFGFLLADKEAAPFQLELAKIYAPI